MPSRDREVASSQVSEPAPARSLRILEIVTVPFFTPRGTAFSALERTAALARLGHRIDILAYGLGFDVEIPNVRIFRIPRVPFMSAIRMGPSPGKLVLDVLLAAKTAWWLSARGPWDLVHAHEESVFWLSAMRRLHRGRVLYDMHSSLVEQLSNFGYRERGWVTRLFAFLERRALRGVDGVIIVCPALERAVRRAASDVPLQLIENLSVGWDTPLPDDVAIEALRERFGLGSCRVVVYTGNFGPNQGMELAIDAMGLVGASNPEARLLLVGGTGADLARVEKYVDRSAARASVILAGLQPPAMMPVFTALADVLLSPRTEGSNTPLKVYSYLAAGKPIVATDLPTHTQVLSSDTAMLVPATAEAVAGGIVGLLGSPAEAAALGDRARRFAEANYGTAAYLRNLESIVERTCATSSRSD